MHNRTKHWCSTGFQKKKGGNKRVINEPSNNIAKVFENHDKFEGTGFL